MRTFSIGSRLLAISVVVILSLTGCIPGFGTSTSEPDTQIYLGPIPSPTAIPLAPELPVPPTFPADRSDAAAMDAYQVEYNAYNAKVMEMQGEFTAHSAAVLEVADSAAAGGKQGVAAWQSLLVEAGVAVAGADGKPIEVNGKTGFGWALTDAQLRLHSVMATVPGGVRLVDLAEALEAVPEFDGIDLAELLVAALTGGRDYAFSTVFWNVGPRVVNEFGMRPLDEIVLSWGQVSLLLHRLSAELATYGSFSGTADTVALGTGPQASVTAQVAAFSGSQPAASSGGAKACAVDFKNPWAAELVNQFNKAHTFMFGELLDNAGAEGTALGLGLAAVVSASITMAMKAAALTAKFTISDSPLVRTKTTSPGEVRDLTVKLSFSEKSWEDIRGCMNLFMAPFGVEIPGNSAGFADGLDVDLKSEDPGVLRVGDGKGGAAPVTQGKTDSSGEVKFRISGAPHSDRVPEQAAPTELTVAVRAVSNLGGNDFYKDIRSLPWDALDALSTGGLSLVPTVLSRMQWVSHTGMVPVRDWVLDAEFEVTAVGSIATRTASHYRTGGGCNTVARTSSSTTTSTTSFASDAVVVAAQVLSNPHGNIGDQAVLFRPPGATAPLQDLGNGVRMFQVPAEFRTEKLTFDPGVDPLPPVKVNTQNGGCPIADGGGATSEPPPPDCGLRDYSGYLDIGIISPRTLYATGSAPVFDLWKNCGDSLQPDDPPAGPRFDRCKSSTPRDGAVPSITDVFDPTKTVFEVTGILSCSDVQEGYLSEFDYEWTLVFCRIVEGEPSC